MRYFFATAVKLIPARRSPTTAFRSINPGNVLKRYVRPIAKDLGIKIGDWHDFRHTLATRSLKKRPTKVVSEILGHSDVRTTLRVYQHVETEDFRAPLNELADELLRDVTKSSSVSP